ncbi:MAG: hypothetical protein AAGA66_18040 [Bacteroidota bacterium]
MDIASEQHTKQADIQDLLVRERGEGKIQVVRNLIDQGLDDPFISVATGLSQEEIQQLRKERNKPN